ncbi:hypothetical protein UVI_02016440 [Ustilaginoidea virens]|uniref:Uncharacterized protein n=1 Tax=Ustilaginoidea virens TaxID=1159556 RepID=A0A1B5KRP8_USTVR|nr:hypothetical protein UVI_02016440 [Ustilaginoidea virens]
MVEWIRSGDAIQIGTLIYPRPFGNASEVPAEVDEQLRAAGHELTQVLHVSTAGQAAIETSIGIQYSEFIDAMHINIRSIRGESTASREADRLFCKKLVAFIDIDSTGSAGCAVATIALLIWASVARRAPGGPFTTTIIAMVPEGRNHNIIAVLRAGAQVLGCPIRKRFALPTPSVPSQESETLAADQLVARVRDELDIARQASRAHLVVVFEPEIDLADPSDIDIIEDLDYQSANQVVNAFKFMEAFGPGVPHRIISVPQGWRSPVYIQGFGSVSIVTSQYTSAEVVDTETSHVMPVERYISEAELLDQESLRYQVDNVPPSLIKFPVGRALVENFLAVAATKSLAEIVTDRIATLEQMGIIMPVDQDAEDDEPRLRPALTGAASDVMSRMLYEFGFKVELAYLVAMPSTDMTVQVLKLQLACLLDAGMDRVFADFDVLEPYSKALHQDVTQNSRGWARELAGEGTL